MNALLNNGDVVLKHYRIIDTIAIGGQAVLYKAADLRTGQVVVVRQLGVSSDDPLYSAELARFQRMGRLRFGHPVLVEPIELREQKDQWFLVFPYIEGDTLDHFLRKQGGRIPLDVAVSILSQVLDGLQALHNRGIIHRDIKPTNIIIQPDGRARIIDLGICKIRSEATITHCAGLLGSPAWMAPEQAIDADTADHRADFYPLGLLTVLMLTGKEPVQGEPLQSMLAPLQQADLLQMCSQLLAPDPGDRPQNAGEIQQRLQWLVADAFCRGCQKPLPQEASFCEACGCKRGTPRSQPSYCLACGGAVDSEPQCPHCRRHFGDSSHRLLFKAGACAGRLYRMPEAIYEVGRNQVNPEDEYISRRHFLVACCNGSAFIQDAGSANRMSVAGVIAEQPMLLNPGQEIRFAGYAAIYEAQ